MKNKHIDIEEIYNDYSNQVYDRYLVDAYGIRSCNNSYNKDAMELMKLKIDLHFSCVDCNKIEKVETHVYAVSIPKRPVEFVPQVQTIIKYIEAAPRPDGQRGKEFEQKIESDVWEVNYSLDYIPNVTILDSNGYRLDASVQYVSNSKILIRFTKPMVGKALLS